MCWEGPFAAHLGLFDQKKSLVRAKDRSLGGYAYSTSRAQLERGFAAGCVWCGFLLVFQSKNVARYVSKPLKGSLKITVGKAPDRFAHTRYTPADLQELQVAVRGFDEVFYGYVYAAADDPAAPYINARSPILDVGSLQSLSIAKALIDECVKTHERCKEVADPDPILPTRVIDCIDPGCPRLVATEGRHGGYLALSYVWGEAQPHRTTTTNISAYTDAIDPSVLPQTIRDAIHVTHRLGYQYLWADSLCIIQDSDEDKRNEIGRMHRIYRSAHLTIIAASARRVSEGFLQSRRASPHDITLPFVCPRTPPARADRSAGETSARQVGEVRIRPQWIATEGESSSTELCYYDRDTEPISARGWCLQELYMSPRGLIFTSETAQLRCQTATQNVGNAICVTHATASERTLPDALFRTDAAPIAHGSEEWFDVHGRWGDIMKDYALRAVGEPSDKLVACGAIAEAFQRVLRTDYLAGLWRARLLWDLLWHRAPLTKLVRAATYRAPSWSWAAVDGGVLMWRRHAYTETTVLAEIIRCEVVLKEPELRFGQVKGGSLVLRAALVRCKLRRSVPRAGWHEIVMEEDDGVLEEKESEIQRRMMAFVDDEADAGIESACLVPLLERRGEYQSMHGLVVVVAHSDGPAVGNGNAYRRIGTFDTDVWGVRQGGRVPLAEIELV